MMTLSKSHRILRHSCPQWFLINSSSNLESWHGHLPRAMISTHSKCLCPTYNDTSKKNDRLLDRKSPKSLHFLRFPGRCYSVMNFSEIPRLKCSTVNVSLSPFCVQTRQVGFLSDPENKGNKQVGVNFDTIGSWNNRISMPIMIEESIQTGKLIPEIPLDKIGTASLLGRRQSNEDRFTISKLSQEYLYFGIFDGHNGALAAAYLKSRMSDHLLFWLSRVTDINTALRQSYTDINNGLARHLHFYHLDDEQFNTGSTATVCLLRQGTELTVAHVGDTRALLCRGGKSIALTHDHHPEDMGEKKRLQDCGAVIIRNSLGTPKVNGNLSMTRCIGNLSLKQYGVIGQPDIQTKKLDHGHDAFLALVSDGVSFVLTDQEVVDIACSCTDPQEASSRVTDQALQFGSEDNTTCVVIPLGAWGKYRTDTGTIQYSFGRTFVRDSC